MRRAFTLTAFPLLVLCAIVSNVGAAILFGAALFAGLYRPSPPPPPTRRLGPLR